MIIELIVLGALVLFSVLDLKYRVLPSILTTSLLFVVAVLNIPNLHFGILSAIFGWLLMEGIGEGGDFFSGMADFKVLVTIGLLITTVQGFLLYVVMIMIAGVVYKLVMVYILNKKDETAFIPVFVIVYVILLGFKFIPM